ncbi:MAG: anaerobic ribonucleoside-triphosphate reductase activating protein [Aquificaceae bacterium]
MSLAGYKAHFQKEGSYCFFKIGGFQRFTLIDYPGKVACIVFTQGCNFRCPYCYNIELVLPERYGPLIPKEEVFSFLMERRGKLDGVVITGGEPTLQKKGLENFVERVKSFGFSVKLDTNGAFPEVVKSLLDKGVVDYIAMDVKAPLKKYQQVVRTKVDTKKIEESIGLIMNSGVDYEFRTTVVKDQLSRDDLIRIGILLKGAKRYYLQRFIPGKTLDPEYIGKTTYTEREFEDTANELKKYVKECYVR